MSKTIEFVEKEIEYTKRKLEQLEIDLNFPFRKDVITHLKEDLQTLEQIKCELEAWEVVKEYTDTSEDIVNTEYYFIKGIDDEFETLKKALEVESESK